MIPKVDGISYCIALALVVGKVIFCPGARLECVSATVEEGVEVLWESNTPFMHNQCHGHG